MNCSATTSFQKAETFQRAKGSVIAAATRMALPAKRAASFSDVGRGKSRMEGAAANRRYCFVAKKRPKTYGSKRGARQATKTVAERSATTKGSVQPCSSTKNERGVNK